ncbi:MAG: hypothetical protein LCH57_07580 [Proteobacteria bacterium]|uniref:hypothetical protein n=1 Tax=Brevundimonas sp. TaxID=1871086 RepID=UPI001ACFD453|nr:hypothetical protein [Brevundimonas sp.]MBN9466160.1 hypothetical protein [Brevundimonas sp.]MCA0367916.1 hypothetical protein [Pseudomonadota bacterium]
MKKTILAAAGLAIALVTAPMPTAAQDHSYAMGDYWDVSAITLVDGQGEAYLDHLATQWKAGQEFAKQRGWIKDYYVLANSYARDGEPDLYLVSVYAEQPTRAQEQERDAAYLAWSQSTTRQLEAASADRTAQRRQSGMIQLRQLDLK